MEKKKKKCYNAYVDTSNETLTVLVVSLWSGLKGNRSRRETQTSPWQRSPAPPETSHGAPGAGEERSGILPSAMFGKPEGDLQKQGPPQLTPTDEEEQWLSSP